eukprot:TRINITY_DN1385_c0_g3_i1.p1 TRINITY_DN1385_c0_g3~~TRINITY_DN1385_c0_g3_i1.p1  ORF type:complete len:451 (+),score=114.65 TRINITY_DN1385_c0_g3_i1:65-1417(+)
MPIPTETGMHIVPPRLDILNEGYTRWAVKGKAAGSLLSPEFSVNPDDEIAELLGGVEIQNEKDREFSMDRSGPVLSSFTGDLGEGVHKPVPVPVQPHQQQQQQQQPEQPPPSVPTEGVTTLDAQLAELRKWSDILQKQRTVVVEQQETVSEKLHAVSRKEAELDKLLNDAKLKHPTNEDIQWRAMSLDAKEKDLLIRELNLQTALSDMAAKEEAVNVKSGVVEQRAKDAQELFQLLEEKSQQINGKIAELRKREEMLGGQERLATMREHDIVSKREQIERFQTLMAEKINKIEETRVELAAWNRDLEQRERLLELRANDMEETERSLSDLSREVKHQQRGLESKISVLRHLERSAKMQETSPSFVRNQSVEDSSYQSISRKLNLDESTDTAEAFAPLHDEREHIVKEDHLSPNGAPDVGSLPPARPAPIDDPAAEVLNSTNGSTNVYDID